MPWSGSGLFTRVHNWVQDNLAAIPITDTRFDAECDSFADGINTCIAKDGQNSPSANLPMAGFKHSNVANSAARTDYAATGQVQDGSFIYGLSTGSGGAYTLNLSPAVTTLVKGQKFRFEANHTNSGAATLAVNGLAAKAIRLEDGSTALAGGEVQSASTAEVLYDGTIFRLLSLRASAFGRSLLDDSDAASGRTTLALGTASTKNTGTSGSTVPVLDGAATTWGNELIVQKSGLGDSFLARSTDGGNSGGPDIVMDRDSGSAAASDFIGALKWRGNDSVGSTVLYGQIGVQITDPTAASEDANLFFRTPVAGAFIDRFWVGAGAWMEGATGTDKGVGTFNATALYVNGAAVAAAPLQVVNVTTGAVATGTTQIPLDDTIPQNTEGDEYMTLAITPKFTTSKLKFEIVLNFSLNGVGFMVLALFKDSVADALAAGCQTVRGSGDPMSMVLTHFMTSGTVSAITFKVRAGPSSALTTTVNGFAAARKLGGVQVTSMTITELLS